MVGIWDWRGAMRIYFVAVGSWRREVLSQATGYRVGRETRVKIKTWSPQKNRKGDDS